MVELVMTDLLSPNMKLLLLIGTPSYIRVHLRSTIWSTTIFAATNSDPYVAVSTVACHLEYQSVGVPLRMWRMAVIITSTMHTTQHGASSTDGSQPVPHNVTMYLPKFQPRYHPSQVHIQSPH